MVKHQKINFLKDIILEKYPKIKFNYQNRDKLIPERGTLDISKAKKLIDFSPNYDLKKGINKYLKWYENFEKFPK